MRVRRMRRSMVTLGVALTAAWGIGFGAVVVSNGAAGADPADTAASAEAPASDPTSAPPEPTTPAPTEPSEPAEPEPPVPAPSEPAEPEPSEPAEPEPSEPAPSEPAEPEPTEPAPSEPAAPAPSEPAAPAPSEPSEPAESEPTEAPARAEPTETEAAGAPTESKPTRRAPAESAAARSAHVDVPLQRHVPAAAGPVSVGGAATFESVGSSAVPEQAAAPASGLVPWDMMTTLSSTSDHVPEIGLLGTEDRDTMLLSAESSPGTASALPSRQTSDIGGPELLAVCAVAMAGALLARSWSVRTRVRRSH